MFDSLAIRDPRPIALVKRTFQVAVCAYLVIGLIAGYRAWYHVHSLDLTTGEPTLRSGTQLDLHKSRNTPPLPTEPDVSGFSEL